MLPLIGRRAFLAGALKTGASAGLGSAAVRRRGAGGHTHHWLASGPHVTQPPAPPGVRRYVTRPDLRPIGVSVHSSRAFRASPAARSYIFCAPKSPHFASPSGAGSLPKLRFPAHAMPGLMILDTSGELVWFKPMPGPTEIPFNFRVQSYGGRPVLTWFQGQVHRAHGIGHYVLADASYTTVAEVHSTRHPADLHEFILTDAGTALHTAYEERTRPGRLPLLIGHAQEVDVASNELLFDWSSYPAVPPGLAYTGRHQSYFDYFHINSIGLWPGPARNLLVSARNTCAVYLIERSSSQIRWQLGGKRSDFGFGRGARFFYQHDARALPDGSGISVFDDASRPSPERLASGKVLTLNKRARTASLRQRFVHSDDKFITPSQGNLQLLPGGAHAVGWGYMPFFSAYARSSALDPPMTLDGRFPLGAASYRTFLFDWVGKPSPEELALVVRATESRGRVRAFVSWNGATEVTHWHLHAGADTGSLQPVARFPRTGFETSVDVFVGHRAAQFMVVAHDASGAVLGSSPVVSID